jgi:hypothetical protein
MLQHGVVLTATSPGAPCSRRVSSRAPGRRELCSGHRELCAEEAARTPTRQAAGELRPRMAAR